ncbi:hypothetical protein [Pseudomonas sp. Z3-8]
MPGLHISDPRQRWRALIVLCLGVLMVVLDGTVVQRQSSSDA